VVEEIDIAGRKIGYGHPCFIIAEAGVNHNGNPEMAHRLVDAAVQAGVDAVKFQTFKADRLTTRNAPKAGYQRQNGSASESSYEMLSRLELSEGAHVDLMDKCRQDNILFLSTPFDEQSADYLFELGMLAFKIPSGEITNVPFLNHIALKAIPLIVSTGMCLIGEVEAAVRAFRATGNSDFVLLHCVSSYPAKAVDVNLRAMHTMEKAFGVPVGYSDHTMGTEVSLAAVALGACVIEKHITLDRNLPGPDHKASLEPRELSALVRSIRTVEASLGHGYKEPVASEANTAEVSRRSLVAAIDIPAGTLLEEDMIVIKRPGSGLSPTMREFLIGRSVGVDVTAGELFSFSMLA
jgi:N,N'-diacetyllegionaminate synthase